MTEAYVMDQLPKSMIISEGARAMALSKPHKTTRKHAQHAANARWKVVKMAQSLGIPTDRKMTKVQLSKAIEKVFE